jgi:hypothetical protein
MRWAAIAICIKKMLQQFSFGTEHSRQRSSRREDEAQSSAWAGIRPPTWGMILLLHTISYNPIIDKEQQACTTL